MPVLDGAELESDLQQAEALDVLANIESKFVCTPAHSVIYAASYVHVRDIKEVPKVFERTRLTNGPLSVVAIIPSNYRGT